MSDLISRQAAIDVASGYCHPANIADELRKLPSAQPEPIKINIDDFNKEDLERFKKELGNTPITVLPAQPDERMLHESCTDCPLYDKDRHSCPRFNKVIPVTLRELQSAQQEQRWIPCSERLPEPRIDVWCNSDMGQMVGYYEENVETWYGRDYLELMVTAWMPLPEPYKGGEHDG